MQAVDLLENELAVAEDGPGPQFLLAGGIYGGKIVIITNQSQNKKINVYLRQESGNP